MAAPEAGNARHLLVFLDQRVGLAGDIRYRDLNLDLTFGCALFICVFGSFSGAHNNLSKAQNRKGSRSAATACSLALSVKTVEEQRQTEEPFFVLTKVTI